MKVFDLICGDGHRFEGWFGSAERYAEQAAAAGIHCPLCNSSEVRREPSAPRIGTSGGTSGEAGHGGPSNPSGAAQPQRGATPVDATALAHLRRLVAATENVGPRFAEEARRIHYDEVPARPIRGTATERERRDLQDEGIETVTLAIPAALTETVQ